MDEPMEDAMCQKDTSCLSLLKASGSEDEYSKEYWPKLSCAVKQLMVTPSDGRVSISYEQTYSCVYKSVCKKYSERLYRDLMAEVSYYLHTYNQQLAQCGSNSVLYVNSFQEFLKRFLDALASIVPIFNYLNKFYIQNKLQSDLKESLSGLFEKELLQLHVAHILSLVTGALEMPFTLQPAVISSIVKCSLLNQALSNVPCTLSYVPPALVTEALETPFTLQPAVISSIVKNLHFINPDYIKLKPALFAKYVPNLRASSNPSQIEWLIQETRMFKEALHNNPNFTRCDMSKKRPLEEDPSTVTTSTSSRK